MPIRMVDDEPNKGSKRSKRTSRKSPSNKGYGSGGGNGIGGIVTSLLPLLMKNPKLLLIVLVIGVGFYLFMGKGCEGQTGSAGIISNFVRGGEFDEEKYKETEIFEALADNKRNPLPERVSLQKYCPTPKNQGQQGSCVAWASAYAARTIIESQRTGKNPNAIEFSPAFMYNQISIDKSTCQGSYIKYAMDNMYNIGAVPFNDFQYDPNDCNRKPSNTLIQQAQQFKIKGFQRLTDERKGKAYEILGMKQNLAKGSPIIIGMMVGGSFMTDMMGQEFWNPTTSDYNKKGFGGHAMCVVGYDDYYEGGSFLLMNSWGTDWGKGGFAWVRYSDFKEFNVEAYGLYPMGNADATIPSQFSGDFGLELNEGKRTIALKHVSGNYFETSDKIAIGDRFKVEFTNNVECYTYVFGEETDGSSYVLFPYTQKHSPYCGITGTRLFPRDKSMVADELGTKDKIAVVVTRKPIDYDVMNKKISSSVGSTYEQKVKSAVGYDVDRKVSFSGYSSVKFNTEYNSEKVIYFVIGINK